MLSSIAISLLASAQGALSPKDRLLAALEQREAHAAEVAGKLWEWAELGFLEERSSALLEAELEGGGFRVDRGVAGMPTAFVASYGSGKPVIAVLAEYDALPGMAQAALPEAAPLAGRAGGQACGHHLLGTAAVEAALVTAAWMKADGIAGTLRVYGTPAEEGGGGKVYMVRAGLFEDVDAVLAWHPRDRNDPSLPHSLAVIAADFTFHGISAHAAAAPERGRSALDGVEAFDYMINMMREHVPDGTRIHYVIKKGGDAPNIVPAKAVVSYYFRHRDMAVLEDIWERAQRAAEGAALGTGTSVEHEVISAYYPMLSSATLSGVLDANMRLVGGVHYDKAEQEFAMRLRTSLPEATIPLGSEATIAEPDPEAGVGSTDVGDVSWVVPTSQFFAATWVPGTPAHSWQAVAAGGTTIGTKGMQVAAKTLALSFADLFLDPKLVAQARAEFEASRADRRWRSRVGDRPPPLDYRK